MRTSSLVPLLLAGLAAGISACATTARAPVQRDVVVSGSRFEGVRGEADLLVRTFVEDAAGSRLEVSGATCAVRSSLYEAELMTPARLIVPNFGPQSPEIRLDCTGSGQAGAARVDIRTNWREAPGGPGWGAPNVGIFGDSRGHTGVALGWNYGGGGYGGGWGPSYPVSDYPNVNVVLR